MNYQSPDTIRTGLRRLLTETRKLLTLQSDLGVEWYPRLRPATLRKEAAPPPSPGNLSDHGGHKVSGQGGAPGLARLREEMVDCRHCPLHQERENLIFGQGSEEDGCLLLIGDSPGPAENLAGLPFQGEAGALLDKMLAAINLDRDRIYLTNLVKCALSGSRPPDSGEIRKCLPFLLRQIEALNPAVICAVGPLAAQTLLRTRQSLLKLRGRFHDCQGRPLLATFSPDFLLHNPEMKKAAWIDLQMLQKKLGN